MFVIRRFLGAMVGITGEGIDLIHLSLRKALEMALVCQKLLKPLALLLLAYFLFSCSPFFISGR